MANMNNATNNINVVNNDILFYENFMSDVSSGALFDELINIDWQNKRTNSSGEIITIKRKMAYMSDGGGDYNYAGLCLKGVGWTKSMDLLREGVSAYLFSVGLDKEKVKFNSCLLNLYANGKDEIRWHSDSEEALGENPVIAMINLGATRSFRMRKKGTETKEELIYKVTNGSLLVMLENCQNNWYHAILKEKEIKEPRISLTFRKVV
jgi:alkylated DNA repair dioxygenase AlkB